jgi:hypothetical protein
MKSSPPVPDILLSGWRIERFNDVTGPIGIMGMVAIIFLPRCFRFHFQDSIPRTLNPINYTISLASVANAKPE